MQPGDDTPLLSIARDAIQSTLQGQSPSTSQWPCLQLEYGGLFVTLRNRRRLRGCMGTFTTDSNVVMTVQKTAAMAARDVRFRSNPITLAELPQLQIEISILSPVQLCNHPIGLEIGRHGIYLEADCGRSGCFLPSVAVDFGWNAEQFLSQCCQLKANLPADAWREKTTRVFLFTTQVLREPPAPISGEP